MFVLYHICEEIRGQRSYTLNLQIPYRINKNNQYSPAYFIKEFKQLLQKAIC